MPCLDVGTAAPKAPPLVDAKCLEQLRPSWTKQSRCLNHMYQHSAKIPLVLTLFGMFNRQIALSVQRDKRGVKVYGEELFPQQRF